MIPMEAIVGAGLAKGTISEDHSFNCVISHPIILCPNTPHNPIPSHSITVYPPILSHHILPYPIPVYIPPYHTISHHIIPYHSPHTIPSPIPSYPIIPSHIPSYPTLSHPIIPYPIVSKTALSSIKINLFRFSHFFPGWVGIEALQ